MTKKSILNAAVFIAIGLIFNTVAFCQELKATEKQALFKNSFEYSWKDE